MTTEERLMKLEFENENLKVELKEAIHNMNQGRQEIANLSVHVTALLSLLNGSGDNMNPGLVKRFIAAEQFIEWIKGKKTVAFGILLAVGAIGTLMWALGELVLRISDIKHAITK